MTFTEIQTDIADRLNLTSTEDLARVGRAINRKYKEITASLGIKHTSRRTTVSASMTISVSTLQFTGAEKIVNVFNRNVSPYKQLDEVTVDELEALMPFDASDTPTLYAIKQMAGDTVTILVNCVPQTAFALYADVYSTAATLSGTDEPVFSESYHDILVSAVLIDEYMKVEKPSLSRAEYLRVYGDGNNTNGRMGELRLWIAVSTTKKDYQGKNNESGSGGISSSGGSGSSVNGAQSYTQTGNIHFDRSGAGAGTDPFTVAAGSGKVDNLDADKLDGLDSTAFALAGAAPTAHATTHKSGGTDPIKLDELAAPTDVTTLNASTTAHGLLKKLSNVATEFFAGTGVWAAIKDSDLAFTDIATNNSSTTKHGFLKKLSNVATEYMGGDGNWSTPPAGNHAVCDGRLTLTTAVPVTTSDVTGATTVYFTPYKGNKVGLYSGSGSAWTIYTFTEKSLALGTLTNDLPYDVFIYDNAGTPTLEFLAWTNKTTRATALVLQDGVLSKTGALTRRYLGTFHTTATTTTEDSYEKRLLWNYYNRVRRPMRRLETTDNWNYQTATWRQANNSTSNQVAAIVGVAEVAVDLRLQVGCTNNNAGVQLTVALKEDSVTAPVATASSFGAVGTAGVNVKLTLQAHLNNIPAVGYHFWAWLEYSDATGTTTWYGDNAANTAGPSSGIHGSIEG